MMIRSAPPASAHLAESPVPAPAPITARAARDRRAAAARSASARFTRHSPTKLVQLRDHRVGEGRIVDVGVQLDQLHVRARRCARTAAKSASSAVGVVERAAWRGDHRDAAERHEQRHGPGGRRELARDLLARARAHSSGVVRISVTCALCTYRLRPSNCAGHRLARAEVDHVESAQRDDLRHAGAARRGEAVRARR